MRTLFLLILLASFNSFALVVKPSIEGVLDAKFDSNFEEQERDVASNIEVFEEDGKSPLPSSEEVQRSLKEDIKYWDYTK